MTEIPEEQKNSWEICHKDYGDKAEAVKRLAPDAEQDPVIACALAMIETANIAIVGRMAALIDEA